MSHQPVVYVFAVHARIYELINSKRPFTVILYTRDGGRYPLRKRRDYRRKTGIQQPLKKTKVAWLYTWHAFTFNHLLFT